MGAHPMRGVLFDGTPKHRCPPWCHQCPDIRDIAEGQIRDGRSTPFDPVWDQFMPGCMGGSVSGPDGCHCRPTGHRLTSSQAAAMRRHLAEYDYAEWKRAQLVKPDGKRPATLRLVPSKAS